jgi:hypothetical protein
VTGGALPTGAEDSPESLAQRIYDSLKITDTAEFLLAVAWVTDAQR